MVGNRGVEERVVRVVGAMARERLSEAFWLLGAMGVICGRWRGIQCKTETTGTSLQPSSIDALRRE